METSRDLWRLWLEALVDIDFFGRPTTKSQYASLKDALDAFRSVDCQFPFDPDQLTDDDIDHPERSPWLFQFQRMAIDNPYVALYLYLQDEERSFVRFQKAVGLHMGLFAYIDPAMGQIRYLYGTGDRPEDLGKHSAHFFIKAFYDDDTGQFELDPSWQFRRQADAFYRSRTKDQWFRLGFARILADGLSNEGVPSRPYDWRARLTSFEVRRGMIYAHSGEIDACILQWLILTLSAVERTSLLDVGGPAGLASKWDRLLIRANLPAVGGSGRPRPFGRGRAHSFRTWLQRLGLLSGDGREISPRGAAMVRWIRAYLASLAAGAPTDPLDASVLSSDDSEHIPGVSAEVIAPALVDITGVDAALSLLDMPQVVNGLLTARTRQRREDSLRPGPEVWLLEQLEVVFEREFRGDVEKAVRSKPREVLRAAIDAVDYLSEQFGASDLWVDTRLSKVADDLVYAPSSREVVGWQRLLLLELLSDAATGGRNLPTAGRFQRWLQGASIDPVDLDETSVDGLAAAVTLLLSWQEMSSPSHQEERFQLRCRFSPPGHLILRAGARYYSRGRERAPRAWIVRPNWHHEVRDDAGVEPVGYFLGTVRCISNCEDRDSVGERMTAIGSAVSSLASVESRHVYVDELFRHKIHDQASDTFRLAIHPFKTAVTILKGAVMALPDDAASDNVRREVGHLGAVLSLCGVNYQETPTDHCVTTPLEDLYGLFAGHIRGGIDSLSARQYYGVPRSGSGYIPMGFLSVLFREIAENFRRHADPDEPSSVSVTFEQSWVQDGWAVGRIVVKWENRRSIVPRRDKSSRFIGLEDLSRKIEQYSLPPDWSRGTTDITGTWNDGSSSTETSFSKVATLPAVIREDDAPSA